MGAHGGLYVWGWKSQGHIDPIGGIPRPYTTSIGSYR